MKRTHTNIQTVVGDADNALKTIRETAGKRLDASMLRVRQNAIEKDVKTKVRQIIKRLAPNSHIFMPVQSGYGMTDLDFIIDINGFSLRIETKVDGKQPSPRQKLKIEELDRSGTPVLVIDQNNLIDVAVVVDHLLTGGQGFALDFSRMSREGYVQGTSTK